MGKTSLVLDFDGIFQLLKSVFPPGYKLYFVLDGLDEVDFAEREIIIQQLQKLQQLYAISLCISFRIEPNNASKMSSAEFTAPSITSIPEDNPDIVAFISAELESCIRSERLVLGNPTLILEIQDALLQGSQGMFLWVALQIESLCAMKTDDAIRRALEDLPKDLPELFSRILRRSEEFGKHYQKSILELIIAAQRPLTTEELGEALSVVPGDTVWNPQMRLNNILSTLACCGSILVIDEEELTVRLVHNSVKKFYLEDLTKMGDTMESANKKMIAIIATYLNYGIFDTQLSSTVVPQIPVGSAPSRIIHSTNSGLVQNLALRLLASRKSHSQDIGKTLAETHSLFSAGSRGVFYFHTYAKSYWLQHMLCISEHQPATLKLVRKLLETGKADVEAKDENGLTALIRAAGYGREAVVKLLLETGKADVEAKDEKGATALMYAAHWGHKAVVKLLLVTGKTDVEAKDEIGTTALMFAADDRHEAVVKLLLVTGKADVEAKDENGLTALIRAADDGHEAVVKLLLVTGKADVEAEDENGLTALLYAAERGQEAVVKLLLVTGKADVEAKDEKGATALMHAVSYGPEAVVKLLLVTGKADVKAKDENGATALIHATLWGHEAVVKLLLETGKADVKAKDENGTTALILAADWGHEAVVKLLEQPKSN
jgi:ankyrin repeat protein